MKNLYLFKMKRNTKPFDLEAAKAGAKVMTQDGQPVTIIKFDVKHPIYPLCGIVVNPEGEEEVWVYTKCGKVIQGIHSEMNLVMAPEIHTGYINLLRVGGDILTSAVFGSVEEATHSVDGEDEYIDTVKVEWEE